MSDFYDPELGSDKLYNITVGVQTSILWWWLNEEGTFFLNINKINNQSDILPNHRIRLVLKDDEADSQIAFFVGLELNGVDWDPESEEPIEAVDFLFGSSYSSTTISSASVSHYLNTPQMSCTATSSALTDKSVYGTFSRTVASDATQSCAWAAIASFFNWTRVGVISAKTDYGLGLSQGFSDCVDIFNISIVEEITFQSEETDHSAKLATIAGSDVFIYFIAMHNDAMQHLAESLGLMNLTGFPYVYIGGDTTGEDTEALRDALPGLIYTAPFQVMEDTNELISLKSHFHVVNEDWKETNGEARWTDSIGVYAPYCWDVALIIADFFHNYTEQHPDANTFEQANWTSFLQGYSAEGASGLLSFDENLDPVLSRWTIHNCNDTKCNAIGLATSTEAELYYNQFNGMASNDTADVYWPSGLKGISNTPVDHTTLTQTWIYITDSAKVFYGIFCGITIFISVCLIYLSYRWRDEKAVRMTSWKLNIVTLSGLDILMLCFAFSVLDEKHHSTAQLDNFCFARIFFFLAGFPLFSGTIFSKIYRVYKIFNSRRYSQQKNPVKDIQILKVVVMYTVLNLIFVTVFQQVYPWKRVINYGSITQKDILNYEQKIYGKCEMDQLGLWRITLFIANGSVLIVGAKWAWDTRSVPYAALNDSVQVGYILMLIILLFAFNIICTSLLSDPNPVFFVMFVSLLIVSWFTIGVLFLHKYWSMFYGDEVEVDLSAYESRQSTTLKCSNCGKAMTTQSTLNCIPQSSMNCTDESLKVTHPTLEMPHPAFQYSTSGKSHNKAMEDMTIDEFLDEVDLSNNSALEEDDQYDINKE